MLLVRGDHVWTGTELLSDAAVLCVGGKIQAIGPRSELEARFPKAQRIGGAGAIVLPGLINAHHHGNGVTSFMRGVVDDALEPWLAALGCSPAVDPYLDSLWAAIGLLEAGYTTVVHFQSTSQPDKAKDEAIARIRAYRDAGLRVAFGLDLIQQNFFVYGSQPPGLPKLQGLSTADYLALLTELRRQFASDPGVSVFAAPSGPQWVTDAAWEAIGAWTQENQVPLHTHCLESPYEAEYARRAYGGSVVHHLDRLGALHELTSLVHGVFLSEAELDLMHERRSKLITNPGSNLRLRCGVSPVLAALERGLTVALGTDACTPGERDDALAEMRLLFYLQRGPGIKTPALTWQQAWQTVTEAAAAVTSWSSDLGSIRPDGAADLTVLDVKAAASPWSHPDLDPRQLLLQRGLRAHLVASVVGGELVYDRDGGPVRVRPDLVAQRIDEHMRGRDLEKDDAVVDVVRQYFVDWPVS